MMRLRDMLILSTRMFRTRTRRTLLTILGVSVGIGAVLFLVSLGYGLQKVIIGEITTADSLLSLDVTPGPTELIQLDDKQVTAIGQLPDVAETARVKTASGQLGWQELTSGTQVQAVDAAYFRLAGLSADKGQLFSSGTSRPMVISSAVAALFNLNGNDALGTSFSLTLFIPSKDGQNGDTATPFPVQEPFTITGIIQDDTQSFVYVPLETIADAPLTTYDLVKVKVKSAPVTETVREAIIGRGFLVSSLTDVIDQANTIFRVIQIILGLFGLIALIVSAIGMFNTMTIALLERTNEIGIMRSVGVTPRDVGRLFLVESTLMGLLGGIGGVVAGFLAGELANVGLNILASSLGGKSIDVFYQPPWFVIVIIAFSAVVGFATGFFPARRAASMDPLDALRYK